MKLLLVMLLVTSQFASASEVDCLSKVIYAEARGEPLEGMVAVGKAAMNRAKRQKISICNIAAKKAHVPAKVVIYYTAIARTILNHNSQDLSGGADSWNTGKKPAFSGFFKVKIGNHVLYRMAAL
jgi:hypothetical protein